jgi:hypothetical protein
LITALQNNASYASNQHYSTLAAFSSANTVGATSVTADLYAAVLVGRNTNVIVDAALAAAIKQTSANPDTLTSTTIDLMTGFSNNAVSQSLAEVEKVASQAKANALTPTVQVFAYVGSEVIANPTLSIDIATAWTVVDPDHAHFVATSIGFNSPTNAAGTVPYVFRYAQITNTTPYAQPTGTTGNAASGLLTSKSFPGSRGTIIDQPAAAAAITAGYVTGILEADSTFRFGVPGAHSSATVTNLQNTVQAAVLASLSQGNVYLQGPTASPFNTSYASLPAYAGFPTYPSYFRQNNGLGTGDANIFTTTGLTPNVSNRSSGVAGAVTGFVAQLTYYGDTTINSITAAVLASAGNSAKAYGLQIAQAAAQAFAWVAAGPADGSTFNDFAETSGHPIYDIANALLPYVTNPNTGVTGAPTLLQQLMNAAYFGISEANKGTIGAGALGLNAFGPNAGNLDAGDGSLKVAPFGNPKSEFYKHASATGTPVTNIFNL